MMIYHIKIFFAFLLLINIVKSLHFNPNIKLSHTLSKNRPLSTVNTGALLGYIPRLEIGLRFIRKHLPRNYYEIKYYNPLDWFLSTTSYQLSEIHKSRDEILPGKLFRDVSNGLLSVSNTLMSYLRKVAATSMIIASSLTPNWKRISAIAASSISTITALPAIAHSSVFKKYQSLSPTQKLATTPLFYVCNSNGNPYLQEDVQAGNPDQRIVVYFMSSEDADEYLTEMAQANPQNLNEFRITATSMEKIVNKIQSRKQSRKLGRYPMSLIYRIQPSSRQCENAEIIAGKGDSAKGSKALKGVSIPLFTAKGMAVKRPNGEIVTPYYFAYEDLLDDWEIIVDNNNSEDLSAKKAAVPTKPQVIVKDFVEVMCLSQGINTQTLSVNEKKAGLDTIVASTSSGAVLSSTDIEKALKSPAIMPPRREIITLRKYYRNEAGLKNEFQSAKIR